MPKAPVLRKRLQSLVLGIMLSAGPAGACAQGREDAQVAYVNIQRVLDASPQMRAALQQIKQEFSELEGKLQTDEATLVTLKTERERFAATLPQPQLQQLLLKMESLERAIKRGREGYAQRVTVRSNEMQKAIERQIGEEIAAVAKLRSVEVVLDAETIVYGHPRLDLTDAVIARLTGAGGQN